MNRSDGALREALRLYLVTDETSEEKVLLHTLREAIRGGVGTVQLRRKNARGRDFVTLGHAVRALTREAGVRFIVNDRVDVAQLVEADGVHIGQEDLPCDAVRKLLPNMLIGVSAATLDEALRAEAQGADYLGVGAVYRTSTKSDARSTGLAGLEAIARAVSIPIVGIGGITPANAAAVFASGAAGVAVVSAIMHAPDPRRAAQYFAQIGGVDGNG
ncbi:thiamine phosphate synthase [Ferroacidibacillus organovorans]|uniref:Thiamine-phosphate synthase n=1 Tax=Ferroacidibacillus organovorans TaxID=1765683 RepID=A0A1V4ETS6_9BACL|nr:thiamine phosphate synthase [Ferroacidibacillus organovorans]OPG16058.1 thiamine-phosphate diphosphorylase [Ferroacidibacillus organovorans]